MLFSNIYYYEGIIYLKINENKTVNKLKLAEPILV